MVSQLLHLKPSLICPAGVSLQSLVRSQGTPAYTKGPHSRMKLMINKENSVPFADKMFSILSILFAVITSILIISMFSYIPSTLDAGERMRIIPQWLVWAVRMSCFLGLAFGAISILKKERLKYWKVLGASINFLLFLFMLGVIGFALYMNWKRDHG